MNGLSLADYFILCVIAWATVISAFTLHDIRDLLEAAHYAKGGHTVTALPNNDETLPELCREFYNDGTEQWINCMGVGYVK